MNNSCEIESLILSDSISPVRYCITHNRYEFDYIHSAESSCDLFNSNNNDAVDNAETQQCDRASVSCPTYDETTSGRGDGAAEHDDDTTYDETTTSGRGEQDGQERGDGAAGHDDDDTSSNGRRGATYSTDDDSYDDNNIDAEQQSDSLNIRYNRQLMSVQRSAYIRRVIRYRSARQQREYRSLDNNGGYENNQIPFHHIVFYMMGPLTYEPHFRYLHRWNVDMSRLLRGNELTSEIYFMSRQTLTRSVAEAENVVITEMITRRVFKIYYIMNKCIMSLLSRAHTRGACLTGVPLRERTLQSVFDDSFISDYWDRFSTDPYIAGLIPLTYNETLDYLYVWSKIVSAPGNNRRVIANNNRLSIEVQLSVGWSLLPTLATSGAAAFDVFSSEQKLIPRTGIVTLVRIGIDRIRLPANTYLYILSRSGHALNQNIVVANSPGLVDSDYRGNLCVLLQNLNRDRDYVVEIGERIAQVQVHNNNRSNVYDQQDIEWRAVTVIESTDTERGTGGFGSSGI